jgi:hypothetical protein
MINDRLSELLRDANPVTREPTRPIEVAWDEIVAGYEHMRISPSTRRITTVHRRRRHILAAVAAIVLIAGVSTAVSVQGSGNAPSLTNAIARAFGVVNANAATSGGFSSVPGTPQGSNHLACPSSQVCYLDSTNVVGSNGATETKIYKTTDGGTDWTALTVPSAGTADTPFSCLSVTVCSIGVMTSPALAASTPDPGTVQMMLTTTDGGSTWTNHVITINPVLGDDAALDQSLRNVQGSWSQLQCFSAQTCIAVALAPSDQPEEPISNGSATGVQRTVIMRTDDGGVTWSSAVLPWSNAADGSPGWSNAQFMDLYCASELNCLGLTTVFHSVVNGVQASNVKVWHSSDGGATWATSWAPEPAIAANSTSGFTCPTTLQCYATVQTGTVFPGKPEVMTTDDGGTTWTFDNPVVGGSDIELTSVSCATASTCWTAGEERPNGTRDWQAAMWATGNSGGTWIAVPLPSGLGIVFQVVCNPPTACLAIAQPPYKSGQASPQGPFPGEILSNQN